MPLDHHVQSRLVSNSMLKNWRSGRWQNGHITKEIFLVGIPSEFPSPDACFFVPRKRFLISIEFKPPTESSRGILTGLGQAVAYLNKASASFLVSPKILSNGIDIGSYLEETFKERIYGKMPIGLITYEGSNLGDPKLICDIDQKLRLEESKTRGTNTNYWAAWRDTPPHAIYLLLKISKELRSPYGRSKAIWNEYYNNYYAPRKSRNTLEPVSSGIIFWDRKEKQLTLEGIKCRLRKKVKEGEMTHAEALKRLARACSPKIIDNHYHDTKKNHFNFVRHLGLWNENFYLTALGNELIKLGKAHGPKSEKYISRLSQIMLAEGRHFELIGDIASIIKEAKKKPSNVAEAKTMIYESFEKKGFIKKNPNRTTSGTRKFLASEFNIWNKLGLVDSTQGSYYSKRKGFNFNSSRLGQLMKEAMAKSKTVV